MAGRDGNVSSPALRHAETRQIGSSSAVPGGAGAGEVEMVMRPARELVFEGSAKMWKYAKYNPEKKCWECRECPKCPECEKNPKKKRWESCERPECPEGKKKGFTSPHAVNGHQHVHKRQRKETHKNLDLNKPPVCDGNGDENGA